MRPKFASKYIGPFAVKRVINDNAYELDLLAQLQIHPAINISRLKAYRDGQSTFPDRIVPHSRPPPEVIEADGSQQFEVDRIIASRGHGRKREYLVQWKGYPLWESTWESKRHLVNASDVVAEFESAALAATSS